MKLYILTPVKEWQPWYDCCFGMVVRADSEDRARDIASKSACAEGGAVWTNKEITACTELKQDGHEDLIIRDVWSA
jgi:hypothetical protein